MAEDNTLKVYALDDGANKHETMTKEQILAAIIQAIEDGTITNIDTGFITKLQEANKKANLKIWVGTNAEFTALETKDADTLYLFTDDPTIDDMEQAVTEVEEAQNDLQAGLTKGTIKVASADNAAKADKATKNQFNGCLKHETIDIQEAFQGSSSFTITLNNEQLALINDGTFYRARLIIDLSLDSLTLLHQTSETTTDESTEWEAGETFVVEIPLWIRVMYGNIQDLEMSYTVDNAKAYRTFSLVDVHEDTQYPYVINKIINLSFRARNSATSSYNTITIEWETTGTWIQKEYYFNQDVNGAWDENLQGTQMKIIKNGYWYISSYTLEIDEKF